MLVQQKPLMRALRRSQTSSDSSPSNNNSSSQPSSWIHLRSVLLIIASSSASSSSSSSPVSSDRGSLKSPWSRRRRKHALLAKQWKSLFDADGKLSDGGIKLLKKVRSGGVEPSIRAEVWPFLLGFFCVDSVPIREIKSAQAMGGDFPSKPISLYATIWDGSGWAIYRVGWSLYRLILTMSREDWDHITQRRQKRS